MLVDARSKQSSAASMFWSVLAKIRSRSRRIGPLNEAEVLLEGYNSLRLKPVQIDASQAYLASAKASPNYEHQVRKEYLAAELLDRGSRTAISMSLCNVEMQFQRAKYAKGRRPNAYRYRCETARCPFCSRRLARQRTRELVPYFIDALSRGRSIYRFTLTQPKYAGEDALTAQKRLRASLEKLRPWLMRREEVDFAALGIDIVCSPSGYHVHAHVTYAGRKLDKKALAEKWSLASPGTSCRPKTELAVGPSRLKRSYTACEEDVFRAVFYSIKGEISTHTDKPRYDRWAQAIVDLKGHARLYSTWGCPKKAKSPRPTTDHAACDDWQPVREPVQAESLSDTLRKVDSCSGMADTLGVMERLRLAQVRNEYDAEYLRRIQRAGQRARDARERLRSRWRNPPRHPTEATEPI